MTLSFISVDSILKESTTLCLPIERKKPTLLGRLLNFVAGRELQTSRPFLVLCNTSIKTLVGSSVAWNVV